MANRKQRRLEEKSKKTPEKKVTPPPVPADAPPEKNQLKVRDVDGFYLKRNFTMIPEDLAKRLHEVPEAKIAIDPDIIITGIKNPVICVFVGLSTTHLITALRRKKKRIDNIIVIEPDLSVFKELIMTEDITPFLADPRIDFLVGFNGSELLTELFKVLSKADPGEYMARVTKVQNMERVVDPFVYTTPELQKKSNAINKIIEETVHHLTLSMGCPDDQSKRWELMTQNRHNMFKAWNASGLKGKFDETTTIVLGGGPTLNEFIDAYHNHDSLKNCLILAADAVLHKLLDNNIKPHIIFRCERKKTQIFKGITKEMTKGIYYASYPWTPPEFFDLFDDHFYLFRSNGVCMFTDISHLRTDGGVSSGNAAFEFALQMGAKNILTSGIDLCLGPNGETHVEGTQVEFNPNNSKAKWSKIKNWAGDEVTTIPVWERCRNEYGQSIDKYRRKYLDPQKDKDGKHIEVKPYEFSVYQTSRGSGRILGAEFKSWEDCQSLCSVSINVDQRLKTHRKPIEQKEVTKFYENIKEAVADLKDIKEACYITIDLELDAKRTLEDELEKMIRRIVRETCKPSVVDGRVELNIDALSYIRATRSLGPNVEKLAKNVADGYDTHFLMKYCMNKTYRVILMDVLQHDCFLYHNKINSLTNMREFADDKFLDYAMLTKDFLDRVEFYSARMIKTFEKVLLDLDEPKPTAEYGGELPSSLASS